MQMNDMVIVSVDDHISEPPDVFANHLSGAALEIRAAVQDQVERHELLGLSGRQDVVGGAQRRRRPAEGKSTAWQPTSLVPAAQGLLRHLTPVIGDMDANGIAASLNFGTLAGFDGWIFRRRARLGPML